MKVNANPLTVTPGRKLTLKKPTKNGHKFLGWRLVDSYTEEGVEYNPETVSVVTNKRTGYVTAIDPLSAGNLALKAEWEARP